MNTLLPVTASILGLLAFFEPCAIATHTLFAARTHNQQTHQRITGLFILWLTRSLFSTALLVLAVAILPRPQWNTVLPGVMLAVMATIYIVSRFVYLPIPHIEFHKLIPAGTRLPHAVKLGLTLPSCTIPLFLVITGISITVDSPSMATVAGVLFATLFTLPAMIVSIKGVSEITRKVLGKSASATPFITAILLFGAALTLWLGDINFNIAMLKTALSEASLLGIGLGFFAGFVFSFNPVSFASIPVVLAYVTKAHEERRALILGGAFVAGMVVTHVVLGVAAAAGGGWVQQALGREWGLALGPLLILLGLIWPGWLKIRLPWMGFRAQRVAGVWGAFLLGIPFSVAVCPFCTPALVVTLTASAAIGSIPFGFALLLAFALGRSIPILLGAWSMGWLESLKVFGRHQRGLEIFAGLTLIAVGLYLLNEYFLILGY